MTISLCDHFKWSVLTILNGQCVWWVVTECVTKHGGACSRVLSFKTVRGIRYGIGQKLSIFAFHSLICEQPATVLHAAKTIVFAMLSMLCICMAIVC